MLTRDRIVAAAERVMREQGLSRATTRQIALEAGFSEGTLYKHFVSKADLFLAVLAERLPPFMELLDELPHRAGEGEVGETLRKVGRAALDFYVAGMPIVASIFSEPELLTRHREEIRARGAGPQRANEVLAAYVAAERELGRVSEETDPEAAAAMLLGACYQRAFLGTFLGEIDGPEDELLIDQVVKTLTSGLAPRSRT